MLKKVYFFIKQTNTKNTEEEEFNSPTAIKKDTIIIKYVQYFYWLVAIIVSVLLTIA